MSRTPGKPGSRRILLATLIGVPLAVLAIGGFVHVRHFMHEHHAAPDMSVATIDRAHAMLAGIGASADQVTRIDAYLNAAMGEMKAAHDGLANTHRKLAALLLSPTVDQSQVEMLRAGQVEALDQASRQMIAAMEEAAQVLTPEQRAKLRELHHADGG